MSATEPGPTGPDPDDVAVAGRQLGRRPRGMVAVAHRCPCGSPDVVRTAPRLPDGTPFPTTYYATCPRLTAAVSTLEGSGLMREMTQRLASDQDLADRYAAAHRDYLRRRAELGQVPEIEGVSAGGMPERVKCLHVLVAHALAAGPGVNPLGDEALEALPAWWAAGAVCEHDPVTRVAGVDCGTNSIRLLVADVDRTGGTPRLQDVVRRMEIVRLGHGVDRTGRIAPEAMARTLAAASDYAAQCSELGAERVRFVATSASRDAANADDFMSGVRKAFAAFDVTPDVVSGDEEASLSFRGAVADLAPAGLLGPYLVVDLGGGSTELVRGTAAVEQARSVDVGSVRMTERHLHGDPPSEQEITAARQDVEAAIDQAAAQVDLTGVGTLVGVAGSITTITAHALRLERYEPSALHLSRVPVDQVLDACTELVGMSREQRAALAYVHPGRVDVIGGGAVVWAAVVRRLARESGITEVVTSQHDILDGIALSIA